MQQKMLEIYRCAKLRNFKVNKDKNKTRRRENGRAFVLSRLIRSGNVIRVGLAKPSSTGPLLLVLAVHEGTS